jgi:hypothetical protein
LGGKFPEVKDAVAALAVQDAVIDYAASGIINDRFLRIEWGFYFRELAA